MYLPGTSSLDAKCLLYKGCQFNIPIGFNWHPLEGVGIFYVNLLNLSSCNIGSCQDQLLAEEVRILTIYLRRQNLGPLPKVNIFRG